MPTEPAQNLLVVHDDGAETLYSPALLEKYGCRYECCPFSSFRPEDFPARRCAAFIFECVEQQQDCYEVIGRVSRRYILSGDVRPPTIFIVSESSPTVERQARGAQLDFFFALPLDEERFLTAIGQIEACSPKA